MRNERIPKFLQRLMPDASVAQHQEAFENFREYMKVVLRIYERILRERAADSRELGFRDRVEDTPDI